MGRYLLTSLRIALVTMVLLGVIYPAIITLISQGIFPQQANGSLIRQGVVVQGSVLLAQPFNGPGYCHPRPSAVAYGTQGLASGGSNLGPTNPELFTRIAADASALRAQNPGLGRIPVDMVTMSASGLDPDITPANAYAQAARIAQAHQVPVSVINALIARHITNRQWGIFGEPRVNVLQLNLALQGLKGNAAP